MMENYVDPTRAAFDVFKSLPRDTPINMLNLVRYRDLAAYPDGHEHAGKGWTGARAYEEYGTTSGPIFERLWAGRSSGAASWKLFLPGQRTSIGTLPSLPLTRMRVLSSRW